MTQFSHSTTGAEVVRQFPSSVAGKTILITGPTPSTLGAATALAVATGNPAHILLAGRTLSKLQPLLDTLNATTKATFIPLDLSSLSSVRHAASTVSTLLGAGKLDILINNAGIMAGPNYSTTVDGIESQFGVNHIGHFLFTNLLLSSGTLSGGRVVNLSSNGAEIGPVRFEDWNFGDGGKEYNPWLAYGQSKSANILFAKGLAKRGVMAFSVHPGLVFGTNLVASSGVPEDSLYEGIRLANLNARNAGRPSTVEEPKTLEQGCATTLVAALDPALEGSSGAFLRDCKIYEDVVSWATGEENVQTLWELSEKLVGQKFEF